MLDEGGRWALRGWLPPLLGLLMLFDSWDSVVIAYTVPLIRAEWGFDALHQGWLISAGYGGQFVGALLFGAVAERWGRVPVLWVLVIAMGVLAGGCALAQDYIQLTLLRLIQGIAVGGGLPVATCYINEIAPTATRGRFFGTFQFIMVSGFGLASLASAWVVPHSGWRPMFALGLVPLLIVPLLAFVPESPRWLAARGRGRDAARALERLGSPPDALPKVFADEPADQPKVPITALIAPGVRGKSLVTALLWFLISLVSFGLLTWIPSIYVSIFKIPLADALRYNIIVSFSVFALPVLLRETIDRVGRRPPVILGTAIGGLALIVMSLVPVEHRLALVGLAIVGQIGISIGSLILWPYTAEIFETRTRSVALGSFGSLARAASMLTPLVVGGVIQATGSVVLVLWIFGLCSLAAAALWVFCTKETKGRAIDS
jgi:putative MFS transporter